MASYVGQIIKLYYKMIKYWLNFITSEDANYINNIYKLMIDYSDSQPSKGNWALLVKKLLGLLGFNEGVGDINLFLKKVKQRL